MQEFEIGGTRGRQSGLVTLFGRYARLTALHARVFEIEQTPA